MEKLAETEYEIHPLIRQRWSPRAFSDKPVEHEKLRILFEAARWAPSCYNQQPWRFLVATRDAPEDFDRMLGCLVDLNIRWARSAGVLMISVARLNFERRDRKNDWAIHDVGLATENLLLQAFDLGLYAHPMAGFKKDKAREVYNIPPDHEPVAAIAIGYPAEPEVLPDDLRKMELGRRSRKRAVEFVFSGTWRQVSPIVAEEKG